MGIISKNIENLKPDKEYIITVRAKNNDVNILSSYTDSVRFRTPTDSTIPNAPAGLVLAASFLNVLFKYDDSIDADHSRYEYQLYKQTQVQIVSGLFQIISGETPHRTGFVQTNVFLVSVDDNTFTTSTTSITNPVKYYGRVRSIDTANNISDWTSIVESDDTPLIDEQFIGSLTAAKITAGTIGAHTITLSGTTSIIQSANFNGTPVGDGSYSNATTGWLINGQGKAYFYDATVVGSIDIGGFDAGSFHVNTYGDMWLGAGTYGAAPFRVSREGVLEVGAGTGSRIGGELIDNIVSYANTGNAAAINFNANNDRNALTPISPVIPSDGTAIDHTINTDGSADISFEWTYAVSDVYNAAANIDGFIVYVRSTTISGATPSSYAFGSSPGEETTYYLPREKRAFILPGVAANRNYNFAVRAYRMVDTDIATPGIVYSPIIQSTYGGELFYQPSTTVAFAGNITGTVNSVAAATITTGISNFNNNNDQKTTTPATPTSVAFSTATSNTNASIDLPLSWTFTGSGDAYDIDGFIVFLRTTTATDATSITTSDLDTNIQQVFLTAEKRSHTFSGISPSSFYKAAVRAYRVVDTNVNSAGILYGPLANTTERSSAIATIGGSTGIKIGNGTIYIGTDPGAFNNTNTGFYVDSAGQFSLKDKLTWNGTDTLSVTGAINATSGTFNNTITVGTNATKINIVGTSATTTTAIYSSGTGYGTGSGFWMDASGRFSLGTNLTWNGTNTLTITGAISGGTIDIGGADTSSFHVDSTGKMWLGAALYDGATFKVSAGGEMTATAGSIGGWSIGDPGGYGGSIYAGSGATLSFISPTGVAWFSGGVVTSSINGFSAGVTTNGGALNTMILRNIRAGASNARPSTGAIGDIYLSY